MNHYIWCKGYKYVRVPTYKIKFRLFGHWFRLFKSGYVRRRVGAKITTPKMWKMYEDLIISQKQIKI